MASDLDIVLWTFRTVVLRPSEGHLKAVSCVILLLVLYGRKYGGYSTCTRTGTASLPLGHNGHDIILQKLPELLSLNKLLAFSFGNTPGTSPRHPAPGTVFHL
jgi:hypothetical protein